MYLIHEGEMSAVLPAASPSSDMDRDAVDSQECDFIRYNEDSTVVLISSYPGRINRSIEALNAVASYSAALSGPLRDVLENKGGKLVVLAERLDGEPDMYEDERLLVLRCWKRNSPQCFFQILKTLTEKLSRSRMVIVQFEFALFGGVLTTGFLPIFLLFMQLTKRKVLLMIHQVIGDLAEVRAHLGMSQSAMRFHVFRNIVNPFYWMLLSTAYRTVVHDETLKERLLNIKNIDVRIIPHGTESIASCEDEFTAKAHLGFGKQDFVILCFGFLAEYKGSDWIVSEIAEHLRQSPDSPIRLVLAGGESPNHRGKEHYSDYVSSLRSAAAMYPQHISITGYVPQERVALYFQAAGLVVFPYRTKIAASGPLALALSYGAPFALSTALKDTFNDPLSDTVRQQIGIDNEDYIFSFNKGALTSFVLSCQTSPVRLERLRSFSESLGRARTWSSAALSYANAFKG